MNRTWGRWQGGKSSEVTKNIKVDKRPVERFMQKWMGAYLLVHIPCACLCEGETERERETEGDLEKGWEYRDGARGSHISTGLRLLH